MKTSKHQQRIKAQPSQQTSGRRLLTDKSCTKTQLLITTHMLKCFIWPLLNAIVLRLRYLAAYLASAESNSILSPVVCCSSRTVRRIGLPRSHIASGDKSWIFRKHTHMHRYPTHRDMINWPIRPGRSRPQGLHL